MILCNKEGVLFVPDPVHNSEWSIFGRKMCEMLRALFFPDVSGPWKGEWQISKALDQNIAWIGDTEVV